MAESTLKEYAIKLGFRIDEASLKRTQEVISGLELGLSRVAGAMEVMGGAMIAAGVIADKNMTRFISKFTQLDIAAGQAKTTVRDLMRLEAQGQAGGFAPGQLTQGAIDTRFALRGNPALKAYLKGLGYDVDHGGAQLRQSMVDVNRKRYGTGDGWEAMFADRTASLIGMSPQEQVQRWNNEDRMKKAGDIETQRQNALPPGYRIEDNVKTARDLNDKMGQLSRVLEGISDTQAKGLSAAFDKLITSMTSLADRFNKMPGGVQTAGSLGLQTGAAVVGGLGAAAILKKVYRFLKGGSGAGGAASEAESAAMAGRYKNLMSALEGVEGGAAAEGGVAAAEGTAAVAGGAAAAEGGLALAGPVGWGIAGILAGGYGLKKLWDYMSKPGEQAPTGGPKPGYGDIPLAAQAKGDVPTMLSSLMDMLNNHWVEFKVMWDEGITVRGPGGAKSTSSARPVSFTRSLSAAMGDYGARGLDALQSGGFEAMTRQFEGWRSSAYPDAGGTSIGYGHHVQPGEDVSGGWSREQGETAFRSDYGRARNTVLDETRGIRLSQNQVGALTDLVYNLGSLKVHGKDRTILEDLKAGNFDKAAQDFLLYDKFHDAAGNLQESRPLYDRRVAEGQVFQGRGAGQREPVKIATTINVNGVQDPAAVADRVARERSRMINDAMRNLEVRTG